MNINPFSHLFETKKYPFSRALRTSFAYKISDTFKSFSGGNLNTKNDSEFPFRLGIFDYLTLGIFTGIKYGLHQISEHSTSIAVQAVTLTITALCDLPRLIVSVLMTITCMPFIAMAHGISFMLAKKYKHHLLNENLEIHNNDGSNEINNTKTLIQLLAEHHSTPDKIITSFFKKDKNNPSAAYLTFSHYKIFQSEHTHREKRLSKLPKIYIPNTSSNNFFIACKALNIGNLQSKLENDMLQIQHT